MTWPRSRSARSGPQPVARPDRIDEVLLGAPTRRARTTATSRAWRRFWPGLPVSVPGVTLNRLCASGMDAVGFAARGIKAGDYAMAIAGGVESMTRAPFVMPKPGAAWSRAERGSRHDHRLALRQSGDAEAYGTDSMPQTADNVAEDFGISRADQDAFAAAQPGAGRGPMRPASSPTRSRR
jgi:acetyl-CoA acyltransferase